MFEWGMLIGAFLYVVTAVLFSVAVTYTLNVFCHYGHIFGFIRWNHAKYVAATNEGFDEMMSEVGLADNWPAQIDLANEIYWTMAANNRKMKLLICPICIGTRVSILTCFFWAAAVSVVLGISLTFSVLLTVVTLFFIPPFVVWFIGEKF